MAVDLLVEDREVGTERVRVERRGRGRLRSADRSSVGARLAGGLHGLQLRAGRGLRDAERLVGHVGREAGLAQDRAVALVLEAQGQVLAAAT